MFRQVFVRSLLSYVGLSCDTVEQMFPCLDQLISVHRALLRSFIVRQQLRPDRSVDDVGDLLVKQVSTGMRSSYADIVVIF